MNSSTFIGIWKPAAQFRRPLADVVRAEVFSQLAVLEHAGVPVDRALAMLRLPTAPARLKATRSGMAAGLRLHEAGLRSGLFTTLESTLLAAAYDAGNQEHALKRLATHAAARDRRAAKMKARLAMPAATTVLACFVEPLPKLVSGQLSTLGYFFIALWLPVTVTLLVTQWHRVLLLLNAREGAVDALIRRAPLFGPMAVRRGMRDFMESLALLLDGGMPMLAALPVATATLRDHQLAMSAASIPYAIEAGASFTEALRGALGAAGIPNGASRGRIWALVESGEASGKLPEALLRCAAAETDDINLFDDSVAEWIPRIVYGIVVAMMARQILGSGAFMPALPPDLQ